MIERRFTDLLVKKTLRVGRNEGFAFVIALLSRIGLVLGVAALILVFSITNDFRARLFEQAVGNTGHIEISSQDGSVLPLDLEIRLQALSGARISAVAGSQAVLLAGRSAVVA